MSLTKKVIETYQNDFNNFQFQNGLNIIWSYIDRANKYIDETSPWVLAKDESKKEELNDVMYHLYEMLRLISIMIEPVMPTSSKIILDELKVNEENRTISSLVFGKTLTGETIDKPIVLFKRLDIKEEIKKHEQ